MKEIKVVNVLEVEGKEVSFSDLSPEKRKEILLTMQDRAMMPHGHRRKTA